MRHTTFRPTDGTTDYMAIANAAIADRKPTQISADEYNYALNVLPPIYAGMGFLVSEATCSSRLGPVHSMYASVNGRYYAKYVVRGRAETYINNVFDAYPLDEEEAKKYEDALG